VPFGVLIALGASLLACACAGVLGVEEITVNEGSVGPSGSEGGADAAPPDDRDVRVPDLAPDAAPPINCPLGCLPPAPAGWVGPSAVFDDVATAKPNACPPLYTVREIDGHQGMKSTAAICGCGTPVNSGATCTVTVERGTFDCAEATDPPEPINVTATPCVSGTGADNAAFLSTGVLARGSCSYPSPSTNVPALTFDKVNIACGLPQNASCANRGDCVAAPIPDAPFTRLCLHAPGDIPCPSFDYGARTVVFERVEDDRACKFTGCTGTPSGGACGTKFALTTPAQCAAGAPASSPYSLGNCSGTGSALVFDMHAVVPSGVTCPPGTATASGTASSVSAVTFCCTR
jgi:hypothetical protein